MNPYWTEIQNYIRTLTFLTKEERTELLMYAEFNTCGENWKDIVCNRATELVQENS